MPGSSRPSWQQAAGVVVHICIHEEQRERESESEGESARAGELTENGEDF